MINNAAVFTEACYDLTKRQLQQYVEKNSMNDYIYIEYSWKQLGRDAAWYNNQQRALNGNKLKIRREIDLVWPLSADKSPFQEETLELLKDNEVEYIGQLPIKHGQYFFNINASYDPSLPIVLSIDVASGLGRDYSVITALHPNGGIPIGSFRNNKVDTDTFHDIIIDLVSMYFPNAVVVIERNNVGLAIIQRLIKNSRISNRLFYYYAEDNAKRKEGQRLTGNQNKVREKIYGVNTSASSRNTMMEDLLFTIIQDEPEVFRLPELNKELRTLERKNSGKLEHADNEHDDTIMSLLIGRWAMLQPTMSRFFRGFSFKSIKDTEDREVDNLIGSNMKITNKVAKYVSEADENGFRLMNKDAPTNKFGANNIFNLNKRK